MHVADNPYFERDLDIKISESGDLPHMHQEGKMQFITFRLADSLPQEVRKEILQFKIHFETTHPKPWDENTLLEYRKVIRGNTERLLDNNHGSCILREPHIRSCLADSIMYFDGIRYHVKAFVIMPNHVHLLIQLFIGHDLDIVMKSIKGYSARKINRILGTSGIIWQRENRDTLIRNEVHYENCINYIRRNPLYLPKSDYTLYLPRGRFVAE